MAGISIPIDHQMLRQAREAQPDRPSQRAFAKQIGRSRVWLGLLERGESDPGLDTLDALARVLGRRAVADMIISDRDRATFNRRVWRPGEDVSSNG
jgi:transcriptional regulator with XRE-family HTH domain